MTRINRISGSRSTQIQTATKPMLGKKSLLSNAVAFALAGLGASSGFAACPGTVTGAETTVCNMTGTDTATINAGGSINVSGSRAIYVDSANTNVTINNAGTVIAGSSDGSDVAAIWIDGDFNGTITNTGTILGEASTDAKGIYVDSDFVAGSTLTNSGTITARAISEGFDAEAVGVDLDRDLDGTVTNSAGGVINAVAEGSEATATGVLVYYTLGPTGSITNNGTISATATATRYSAEAYGIYVDDYMEGSINNTGTISALATGLNGASATATGVYLSSTMYDGSQLTNSGTITAQADSDGDDAEAIGVFIYEMGGTNGVEVSGIGEIEGATFTNTATGIITATASGDYASATGVLIDGTVHANSMVSNAGTITARASGATESATAYGIYIDDELEGVVDNSGTITVTATGATDASATGIYLSSTMLTGAQLTNSGTVSATAVTTESSDAEARGVYIYEMEGATFTNTATGNIAARSTSVGRSGEASGLEVDGLDADSTIINQGTITAVSEGGASSTGLDGFGMHIDSPMGGTISSSGTISATATSTGTGPVQAYGILIHNTLTATGSVDNSGTISASASGVAGPGPKPSDTKTSGSSIVVAGGTTEPTGLIKAAGIYVYSGMEEGSTLTNSGTITATAAGPDAEASGIRIDGSASGALVSSGDINVTGGEGVGAHGILINSTLTATGSVENTGNISVSGPGGDASGTAGIYVWSMDSAATLSNSGTITASPVQGAFSLYVEMGNAASISNSGRLDGGLYLNGASLASSGTVAIPVGVSGYIGGDYTQSAGGVFEVGVLSSSEGGYGQLRVDGTADLSASNQLAVNVSANDMLVDEEVIEDVLSAGTLVTGEELTVSDNSTLWDFTAVNDGLNNIDLGVIRGLFIADAVRLTGPAWALGAATSLDAIIEEGPQGDMATVIGEMGTLSTPEQVSAAAAQTVPVLVAQSSQMANLALNTITDAAINRNYARKGMASGDELMSDQHLWVKPFGSYADQDERDGVPGFKVDNYGLVIGYDQGLTDAWTVGGAIGYSDASVKDNSDLIDHKLDVKSVQLAAYADWQIDQDTFLDIIGVVGGSDNDSKRVIRFADIDRTADGSYDSWYGRLYAGVGRNFVYDKLTLTPVISATYSYLEDDSYTETGADSLNLKVDDNDADSFVLGIDGRLSYALNEQDSRVTAHVGAGYDTISDIPALTSTFVGGGPAFTTEGAKPDQVVYQAGVGLEFHATDQVDVYINYEYEGREDFSNQLAVATVRWAF